jgi:hypothetical protein
MGCAFNANYLYTLAVSIQARFANMGTNYTYHDNSVTKKDGPKC